MIPDEAVEAAAVALCRAVWDTTWAMVNENQQHVFRADARAALEAALPHLLSHEREETRLAHVDAMVNRETKRAELAEAWDDGHSAGVDHADGLDGGSNPYE